MFCDTGMSLSLPRKYGMRKKRHCFGDVKGFVRIKTMLFCTNRNVSHHTEKSQSDGHFPYWRVGAVHSFVIVSLFYKTTTLRSKQNDKTSQDEVVCWSYGTCPELCDFSVWRTASRDRSFVILFILKSQNLKHYHCLKDQRVAVKQLCHLQTLWRLQKLIQH